MEEKQKIIAAAAQAVVFGFEKGYEAAIDRLKSVADTMPDETTKILVAKLVEGLEAFSAEARINFVEKSALSLTKIAPDIPTEVH